MKPNMHCQSQEKKDFLCRSEEVQNVIVIREVLHPTSVSNPIVVPKTHIIKKRTCVDFMI
jgi:hypothetical protein